MLGKDSNGSQDSVDPTQTLEYLSHRAKPLTKHEYRKVRVGIFRGAMPWRLLARVDT